MMKAIPYILLLPLALIVLFTQCEKEPEINPNAPVDIPDPNFLAALIEEGVDVNGDGEISNEEAGAIISLDVGGDSISDMTGIEKFINLDTLICWGNRLLELDISNNTDLIYLSCHHNSLSILDLSKNPDLTVLHLGSNSFAALDLSANTSLEELWCLGSSSLGVLDL